jgi:hypothetical protein
VSWTITEASPWVVTPGGEPGFFTEWFPNESFTDPPQLTTIELDINRPDYDVPPGFPGDHFSVRYTGSFYVPADDSYIFQEHVDDEAWLLIDGVQELHNNTWNVDTSVALALTEGWHDIEFRQREGSGGDYCRLSWDGDPNVAGLTPMSAWVFDTVLGAGAYNVGGPGADGSFGIYLGEPRDYRLRLEVGYLGITDTAATQGLGLPEPASLALLGAGLLAIARRRRR